MYMFRMQNKSVNAFKIHVGIFKDFLYMEKHSEIQKPVLHNMRYMRCFHGNLHKMYYFPIV